MGDLVSGALVGALLTEVICALKKAWRCKENCKKLESTLNCVSPHVKRMLGRGNETCQMWLKDMEDLLKEAKEIINKYCSLKERSKMTMALFYLKKPRLSSMLTDINTRMMEKIWEAKLVILDVAQEMHDVMDCPESPMGGSFIGFAPRVLPAKIVSFENDPFQNLKTLIMTESVPLDEPVTLGLKGVGGAGKTLIAQMLHNDADIQAMFGVESILWVTVGKDAKLASIFKTMGMFLNDGVFEYDYSGRDEEDQRAYLIGAFKVKKFLLILDDVWDQYSRGRSMMEWLDVSRGGGSVTLVTTRSNIVLSNAKAKATILVPLLSQNEGWKLFCYNAFGSETPQNAKIEEIAEAICKECHGLPLALEVIGGTMCGQREPLEWTHALTYLKQSKGVSTSLKEKLFYQLKLSYDDLSDEKKKCFLYFAAFPEDYEIATDMLCTIWNSEKVTPNDANDIAGCNYNQGMMNLIDLANQSLIHLSEDRKTATIHDILRDLAIRIIREAKPREWASQCYFQAGKDLETLPSFKSNVKRVSLIGTTVRTLPESIKIPHLQVLLLSNFQKSEDNEKINDLCKLISFKKAKLSHVDFSFTGLEMLPEDTIELITLASMDLSGCSSLKQLPDGIKELKGLTSLNLHGCSSLKHLPNGIKELKGLTSLNLHGCSSLRHLPYGIKELKGLTSLDLSECSSLQQLPDGIKELKGLISMDLWGCSSLKHLPEGIKELTGLTSLNFGGCSSLKHLPDGLKKLKGLTSLDLSRCSSLKHLPDGIEELKDLTSLKLKGCLSLQQLPDGIKELKGLTSLDLWWCSSLKHLPDGIKELKSLTSLDLSRCSFLKHLPDGIEELKGLSSLDLSWCSLLQELPDGIKELKGLTSLDLWWCSSLKQLPDGIKELKGLTSLNLSSCLSLQQLPDGIKELKGLKSLDLSKCSCLKELPDGIKELKGLTSLNLRGCFSLKQLPNGIKELKGLKSLDLSKCSSLQQLPDGINELKGLRSLNFSECSSLQQLPDGIKELKGLTSLNLWGCSSLKQLSNGIKELKDLTSLDLSGCSSLKQLPDGINELKGLTSLDLSESSSTTSR